MKPVLGFLLIAFCLLFISFSTSACNCSHRGIDGEGTLPIIDITLAPTSPSPQSETMVSGYVQRWDVVNYLNTFSSTEYLFSLDRTGKKFFINSAYFDTESNRTSTALTPADSLSFCSFTRVSSKALCAVTRSGTAFNAFVSRSLPIHVASSSASLWEDFRGPSIALVRDTARFTSADQYEVTTVIHPVLSNDDTRLAYIRQRQTRRLVIDEAGDIVDDMLLSTRNDLVLQNTTSDLEPAVLLENVSIDERLSNHIAISPDGNHVAIAQEDGHIHLVHVQSGFAVQFEGVRKPEFSSSSSYLIGVTGPRTNKTGLNIYNLANHTLQDSITTARRHHSVDASRDVVFHYSLLNGLKAYSLEDGTETTVFVDADIDEYERNTSDRGASLLAYNFIGVDENGNIHLISQVDFRILSSC